MTDQLLDAHGLHRYLLWEHQKLAWAQQALHRKGQGPTAQSLGPVLHSLVRGFQADSRSRPPPGVGSRWLVVWPPHHF